MKNQLTLLDRLNLPTSQFFKPLVTSGIWMAALAAAIVAFQTQLNTAGIPVPAIVMTIAKVLGIISATISGIGKLTVDFEAKETKQLLKSKSITL